MSFLRVQTAEGKGPDSRGRHVGRHLEEIAFLVVPKAYEDWDFYSDSSTPPRVSSPNRLARSATGAHNICSRINPATGKPCNKVFSRSCDIARHEDSIHSVRESKTRCHICTGERIFSRRDALVRHCRIVHPQFDTRPWHRGSEAVGDDLEKALRQYANTIRATEPGQ